MTAGDVFSESIHIAQYIAKIGFFYRSKQRKLRGGKFNHKIAKSTKRELRGWQDHGRAGS